MLLGGRASHLLLFLHFHLLSQFGVNLDPHPRLSASSSSRRSEVKARQDVKPDFRHPPFTDYRQPPVDYRHPPVTDYRQPPTLDYRQPPGLLDFRQHPAAAQFPLGIPTDFRPQVGTPTAKRHSTPVGLFSTVRTVPTICFVPFVPFLCRTMTTSQWSWRKAPRVSASASAEAESTRWTCLCYG